LTIGFSSPVIKMCTFRQREETSNDILYIKKNKYWRKQP